MTWQITEQGALFAIFILAFAWSGYRRGWRRETISLLFIVLGLVFLLLNGGVYLAKLIYQLLLNVNLSNSELITSHQRFLLIITVIAVGVIVAIGYAIGRRRFLIGIGPDRTLGIIPGILIGALVAAYVTYFLFPSTQTTVISAGTFYDIFPNLTANFTVVVIFIAAVVVIIIGLAAVRPKKGSITVKETITTEKK